MPSAMIAKLESYRPLTQADKEFLLQIVGSGRRVEAGSSLIHEGERAPNVKLILDGHAFRYKLLPDGKRQIIGYLIAGDFCDIFGFLVKRADHSITARTECRVADLEEDDMWALMSRPNLARVLGWTSFVDSAILREWLVNVGRRNAERRVAHVLCELLLRLQVVGHATSNSFALPLTQGELADTVGLTTVSVNRALQHLKRSGLIAQSSREITIPDVSALMDYADFDATYLHLRERNEPLIGKASDVSFSAGDGGDRLGG